MVEMLSEFETKQKEMKAKIKTNKQTHKLKRENT